MSLSGCRLWGFMGELTVICQRECSQDFAWLMQNFANAPFRVHPPHMPPTSKTSFWVPSPQTALKKCPQLGCGTRDRYHCLLGFLPRWGRREVDIEDDPVAQPCHFKKFCFVFKNLFLLSNFKPEIYSTYFQWFVFYPFLINSFRSFHTCPPNILLAFHFHCFPWEGCRFRRGGSPSNMVWHLDPLLFPSSR